MRRRTDFLSRSGRQTQAHQRTGVHRVVSVRKTGLEQFMNGVDRTLSASIAARHPDEMVQECVRWGAFRTAASSDNRGCRIDPLATCHGLYTSPGTVTRADHLIEMSPPSVVRSVASTVPLENSIRSKEGRSALPQVTRIRENRGRAEWPP